MNTNGPYYHFTPIRLGAGSLVEPGNFGRILKRYLTGTGNAWMLARELVFEKHRPPSKPSRLSACFALPTTDDAERYRQANDQNFLQVLHEVEVVDPLAVQHLGSLSYLDFNNSLPFMDPTTTAAISYWSGAAGDPMKGIELVTTSGLRVMRALD